MLLPAICLLSVSGLCRQVTADSSGDRMLSRDEQIEALLDQAWNQMMSNIDSARQILSRALALSARDSDYARIGDVYTYTGSSYYYMDDYDSALFFYRKAEDFYKRDTSGKAAENIAANRMSIGTAFLQQGNHEVAINAYLQAIRILEQSGDTGNLITAYANTGLVYSDLKQFDKALGYHRKALDIAEKYPPDVKKEARVQLLMFIALDYLNLKQYEEAHHYLIRSEEKIKELHSDYLSAVFYGHKGRYFYETGAHSRSVDNLNLALKFSEETGQQFQKGHALMLLGLNFLDTGNYPKSIDYLLKSLAVFRKIGDRIRERVVLKALAQAYAHVKNYPLATRYYQAYFQLNDSLNTVDSKRHINEIENKYQAQRKADSILVLTKSNEIQQLSLHKRKNLSVALSVGIVLLILIGVLIYRNLRHRHRILEQNELLHAQRIQELEKEHRLVAMQLVLKGQEEERSRLARDLHDGVGGLLSGVKLSLSTMKGNVFLSEESVQSVNNVLTQLDRSIAELRRVSHNMMPEALIKYGLKEALENYCENINLSGTIKIQMQTYGMESRMEQNTEIILYRIVQELLNNIIKHAGAKNALVQLAREEERFSLTVEDDGVGFYPDKVDVGSSAGLANIKARVEYLDGTIDIQSTPGEGTSVNIVGKCG